MKRTSPPEVLAFWISHRDFRFSTVNSANIYLCSTKLIETSAFDVSLSSRLCRTSLRNPVSPQCCIDTDFTDWGHLLSELCYCIGCIGEQFLFYSFWLEYSKSQFLLHVIARCNVVFHGSNCDWFVLAF